MTPARWTFAVIFGVFLLIGIGMGVVNLVAPGAADISFNGAAATGPVGIVVAGSIWGIFGLIFGLIIAGIVALFTRKRKAKA